MIPVSTSCLPRHCSRARAKAARELTSRPSMTVTTEMPIEFIRNRANGTLANTAL